MLDLVVEDGLDTRTGCNAAIYPGCANHGTVLTALLPKAVSASALAALLLSLGGCKKVPIRILPDLTPTYD